MIEALTLACNGWGPNYIGAGLIVGIGNLETRTGFKRDWSFTNLNGSKHRIVSKGHMPNLPEYQGRDESLEREREVTAVEKSNEKLYFRSA